MAGEVSEPMMTLGTFLERATSALKEAGLEQAWREARWLAREVLGIGEADLVLRENVLLGPAEKERLRAALERRTQREPLACIAGRTHFLRWQFSIEPGLFVPRPETEVWVEVAAARLSRMRGGSLVVVDVGCGTGVIGLSLCLLGAASRALLVDVSAEAAAMARRNARALGLESRALVVQGDLLRAILPRRAHAIVANLPYVERGAIRELEPEIARWEPPAALDGGEDGLDLIRRLLAQVAAFAEPPRLMALEVGAGQAGEVDTLVRGLGRWKALEWVSDYGGIKRAVIAYARD